MSWSQTHIKLWHQWLFAYLLSELPLPLQGIEDVSVDDKQTRFLGFGVNLFPLLRFLIL